MAEAFGTFTLAVYDATTDGPGARSLTVRRRGRLQTDSDK